MLKSRAWPYSTTVNCGPPGYSMQHNRIGSHHQRDQVHVAGYTNGVDEHTEQPHKPRTPRAPHPQRGLPI